MCWAAAAMASARHTALYLHVTRRPGRRAFARKGPAPGACGVGAMRAAADGRTRADETRASTARTGGRQVARRRRTFAPVRPGVNVAHGEDALRAYLAWDGHARAAHMDPDAFARWLEREVLQYVTANRASLLRARADGVRRLHAPTLDPLAHALERAEAEYRGSAEGARIERATHAVAQRRAAVAGIRSFLRPTPPRRSWRRSGRPPPTSWSARSRPSRPPNSSSKTRWRRRRCGATSNARDDALRAERDRTGRPPPTKTPPSFHHERQLARR